VIKTRFEKLVSLNCPKQNISGYSKKGQICFSNVMVMGTHFKHKKIKMYWLSVKSAVFGGEKKNSFVLGRKCFIATSSVYYYSSHAQCKIQKCQVQNKRVVGFFSLYILFLVGSSYFTWHVNDHWNNIVYGVFFFRRLVVYHWNLGL